VPALGQAAPVRALEPAPRPVTDRAQAAPAAALAMRVPDPTAAPTAARVAPRRLVPAAATIPPVADSPASWPDKEKEAAEPRSAASFL
jgi:hypothetical protein